MWASTFHRSLSTPREISVNMQTASAGVQSISQNMTEIASATREADEATRKVREASQQPEQLMTLVTWHRGDHQELVPGRHLSREERVDRLVSTQRNRGKDVGDGRHAVDQYPGLGAQFELRR